MPARVSRSSALQLVCSCKGNLFSGVHTWQLQPGKHCQSCPGALVCVSGCEQAGLEQVLEPEAAAVSDPTLTPAAVAEAKVVARMREQRRSFVPESAQLDSCDLQVRCMPAHLKRRKSSSTSPGVPDDTLSQGSQPRAVWARDQTLLRPAAAKMQTLGVPAAHVILLVLRGPA